MIRSWVGHVAEPIGTCFGAMFTTIGMFEMVGFLSFGGPRRVKLEFVSVGVNC